MNGDYDEGLRVYVLKEKDGILDRRFKETKNYGDMWKPAFIDLSNDTDKFRIVFEGMSILLPKISFANSYQPDPFWTFWNLKKTGS